MGIYYLPLLIPTTLPISNTYRSQSPNAHSNNPSRIPHLLLYTIHPSHHPFYHPSNFPTTFLTPPFAFLNPPAANSTTDRACLRRHAALSTSCHVDTLSHARKSSNVVFARRRDVENDGSSSALEGRGSRAATAEMERVGLGRGRGFQWMVGIGGLLRLLHMVESRGDGDAVSRCSSTAAAASAAAARSSE